ncbi:hypothetical protein Pcinc_027786 [Petrolisthes cinctipes]|uniref:Probable ATP-dependent RNA helicase DDX52 n=1 Tax=Petrolisthes cinctipes TaxID=88211 RepID=A0AAE1F3Q4_PETCI|nr:hypothetical protein Pcinc_027786 [Petrolisthes cinctipes]
MNTYDIFKNLTRGIKFNHKKFKNDFTKSGGGHKNDDKPKSETNHTPGPNTTIQDSTATQEAPPSIKTEKEDGDGGGVTVLAGVELSGGAADGRKKKKKSKKDSQQLQLEQQQEQVNHMRNKLGISVWGSDIPPPVDNFDKVVECGVSLVMVNNLRNQGYQEPTPVQAQAWPLLLQGRDLLAAAPTGSGKTAGFVVPMLHQLGGPQRRGFRALILTPTRELARQIHRECGRLAEGLGIRATVITNVNKARAKYGPQSAKKIDVLVTTPNRLVYLLRESDDGPPLSLDNVEMLVVDESDRLFEEGGGKGGGFRDQLAEIYRACTHPAVIRAFFSATHSHQVQQWCATNLNNPAMINVGVRNTACKDVHQTLTFCGDEEGKLISLRDIFRKGYEPPVLVFVQTKERAKHLFRELVFDNLMVDAIHADRTQTQRDNVVRAFRERKIWVLVCTELMSRGIDFKGVNLVINYDFPPSTVSYIHRVGRTGRAGRQGRAITFWTMLDKPYLRSIAQVIQMSGQEVPQWMLDLKKPNKSEKKILATQQPDRGHLSQAVLHEQLEKKKKRQMKARRNKGKKRMPETEKTPIGAAETTTTPRKKRKKDSQE